MNTPKTQIRQLKSGNWVAENLTVRCFLFREWSGIDRTSAFTWPRGHKYYLDCICKTKEEAQNALDVWLKRVTAEEKAADELRKNSDAQGI